MGLDYAALFSIAEMYGIEMTPGLMDKIRVLESRQLEKWREEDDNNG